MGRITELCPMRCMKLQVKRHSKMAILPTNSIQQAFICLQLCAMHCAGKLLHHNLIIFVLKLSTSFLPFPQHILYRMMNIKEVTNMVDPRRNKYDLKEPQPNQISEFTGDLMQSHQNARMSRQAVFAQLNYQSEMAPEAVSLLL